jgi:F-type H+-transporting ATPase subunit b
MPQLDTYYFIPQLFWLGVSFLILFLGMHFIIQPRLDLIFRKRSHKLGVKLREIDHLKEKTEKILLTIQKVENEQRQVTEDILLIAQAKALKYLRKHEDLLHKNFLAEMAIFDRKIAQKHRDVLRQMQASEYESTQLFLEELLHKKIPNQRLEHLDNPQEGPHGF